MMPSRDRQGQKRVGRMDCTGNGWWKVLCEVTYASDELDTPTRQEAQAR